jgi:hypothetical protein
LTKIFVKPVILYDGLFFSNGVFMLKKTTIAVLGLAASGLATAGTMGPACVPESVTVPCAAQLWDLGAEALYFRSMFGAQKTYQLKFDPTTASLAPRIKDVRNDWDWGYRLTGSYHFNTGNDVTVNWTHFHSNARAANILTLIAGTDLLMPSDFVGKDRFDQVNIVMGQHVDLGMRDHMRFYAGMQYANIQAMAQTFITNPAIVAAVGSPLNLFDNTDYKGFGPSIGIDYSYDIYNGLSLTANGSGSILYGTSRYHEGLVVTDFNLIEAQVYARKKAVVPSLEAKLGLNYAYNFAQGTVNINAGYQAINYFSVLTTQPFQMLTNLDFASVNYGLFGPYFGLKYVGNA